VLHKLCFDSINVSHINKKMSRLNKSITTTIVEPESWTEDEIVPKYEPQHPVLKQLAALTAAQQEEEDHLGNYNEVRPLENRAAHK
jgi:hypothetical protein